MRTISRGGVTLQYPDEVGFAFNPCLIVAKGDGVETMTVEMTGEGGTTLTDSRDAFDGGCYAEVREYVQGFFDTDAFSVLSYDEKERTKTGQRVLFRVVAGGQTFDFSVFYIWGAMKAGGREVYNGPRVLTAFVGYPFTYGVFISGAVEVQATNMNGGNSAVQIPSTGVWNVPLVPSSESDYYVITSDGEGIQQATFDDTFDLTFRFEPFDEGSYLRVKVGEDVEDGMYLRWIDRHGFYCYYLFKKGNERLKVKNDGEFVRNNIITADMEYGYNGGLGRQMRLNREEVVPVCASLVDGDTWDMLSDMVSSPILDLFTGYVDGEPRWVSVQCEAATYTKSRAVLQDFIANIMMPEVAIQKL